jgi:hypothetical protein
MSFQTPIVFIIFSRPETTRRVFEEIRKAQPKRLFIIADGPRPNKPGEQARCAETREIVAEVDWDCEVSRSYSEINLGCGVNISQGLDWVFEQAEEAIILEDDCLPSHDFFTFCGVLLEKYRDNHRIMHIAGTNNLINYQIKSQHSYYYSRYPLVWGWASWRRAWKNYDFKMEKWLEFVQGGWLEKLFDDKRAAYVWDRNLGNLAQHPYTWDYQWLFSCWTQEGLAIHPKVNLVSNIGFGDSATHTSDANNPWANLPIEKLSFPLDHPPFVIRDAIADRHLQKTLFDPSKINKLSMLANKIIA